MVRKFHKHKLLLDEGFPVRSYFPLLNRRFDVKHITQDFKQVSLSDKQVHRFAAEHDRIVVTLNIRDFKPLSPTSKNTGVIGVSANLPYDQVDKKLTALLNKSTKNNFLVSLPLSAVNRMRKFRLTFLRIKCDTRHEASQTCDNRLNCDPLP